MKILYKKYKFSKTMITKYIDDKSYINMIQKPLIIDNKDNIPLYIYARMKTLNLNLEPQYQLPKCISDNIDYMFAIQLDFDNGFSIEQFKEQYKHLKYILYTSWSYGFKPNDRFRVILPIKEKLPIKYLVPSVKNNLHLMFKEADITCFDKAHWQAAPAIRISSAPYYYYINKGEILDLPMDKYKDSYEQFVIDEQRKKIEASSNININDDFTRALIKAQKLIDEIPVGAGVRNKRLYSILAWLKKIEAPLSDVYKLNIWSDYDKDFNNMIKHLWG